MMLRCQPTKRYASLPGTCILKWKSKTTPTFPRRPMVRTSRRGFGSPSRTATVPRRSSEHHAPSLRSLDHATLRRRRRRKANMKRGDLMGTLSYAERHYLVQFCASPFRPRNPVISMVSLPLKGRRQNRWAGLKNLVSPVRFWLSAPSRPRPLPWAFMLCAACAVWPFGL